MKIIADKNIPYVGEAFAEFGETMLLPGREISKGIVRGADILLVRTVTPVGRELLEGSTVQFVGTATIGYDHVDTDYLRQAGIEFSSAAGCNANSVAEYIVASFYILAAQYGLNLSDLTVGIIGVGNVGSRVSEKARAIGMQMLLNDPPKARETGDSRFQPLQDILRESDIITLHVPLTSMGPDPTYHMADTRFLNEIKRRAFLMNTSRGAVVDTPALVHALKSGTVENAVIDVWEDEPQIPTELLEHVAIGTPHIAGYSRDGKANATLILYRAACECFGRTPVWNPQGLPDPEFPVIDLSVNDRPPQDSIAEVIRKAYDILRDDRSLRAMLDLNPQKRGAYFDRLRNEYPVRREFHSMAVRMHEYNEGVVTVLRSLGFQVNPAYEIHEPKEHLK